jgi:F420-non-reducing hydrogenase small subunit
MVIPKIALYWCSSCGGCDITVVDLHEDILKVVGAVDIIFWPVAMDFKYEDIESLQDREIAVTLINGSIRMDEQEHIAKILRQKSKLVIANGSCAHLGGVPGLANFSKKEDIINRAFKEVPTLKNPLGILPELKTNISGDELSLPLFLDNVKTLDQIIDVDYYIPGCPPPPELIKNALLAVLQGNLPPKGSVLAEKKALCDTCPRKDSKPEKVPINKLKRIYETEWNPEKCFLEEGVICLGPSTRGGCESRCIKANFPCRGCFGPTDSVIDQGAKSLSALASIFDSNDEKELKKIADSIPDPGGLFYRYSLASSILKKKKHMQGE